MSDTYKIRTVWELILPKFRTLKSWTLIEIEFKQF